MESIELGLEDFEGNPNILIDQILQHKQNSNNPNCNWFFAIVGYEELPEAEKFEGNSMFKIYVDLRYITVTKEFFDTLKNDGFTENKQYRPNILDYEGAIFIYCETL